MNNKYTKTQKWTTGADDWHNYDWSDKYISTIPEDSSQDYDEYKTLIEQFRKQLAQSGMPNPHSTTIKPSGNSGIVGAGAAVTLKRKRLEKSKSTSPLLADLVNHL